MPASGFQPIVFTAGEVPTASQWNQLGINDASFNNGLGFNDQILQSRHFGLASVPGSAMGIQSQLYAYLSGSNQGISNGIWTPVNFYTSWFNNGAIPYVINTNTITVPYTGIYLVTANVSFYNATGGNNYLVGFSINTTSGPTLPWSRQYPNGGTASIAMTQTIPMNAGDKLTVYGYSGGGTSVQFTSCTAGTSANGYAPQAGDLTFVNIRFTGTQY